MAVVLICFITIAIEVLHLYLKFKTKAIVDCTITKSEKTEHREDGCLVDEYWLTSVEFKYGGVTHQSELRTSSRCNPGQVVKCFYDEEDDTLLRRRDLRYSLSKVSPVILSVGILFLIVNLILSFLSRDLLTKLNIVKTVCTVLTVLFGLLGIFQIITAVLHKKNTSRNRIEYVECLICDIIRKEECHNENTRYTYYPVYKYSYRGSEHIVRSKLERDCAPKLGSKLTIPISRDKGGPVEYPDSNRSLILGTLFIFIAVLILLTVVVPII